MGLKIQMVKAVGMERERKKQIIVDSQWNLKAADFMYLTLHALLQDIKAQNLTNFRRQTSAFTAALSMVLRLAFRH